MKAVILAGGLGTRLSEETVTKPKPMVEIGGVPILVHILKTYAYYGITDFIICCGYKGYVIKEYFSNYFLLNSDVTIDLKENKVIIEEKRSEPWKITLVNTGEDTMTGGRIKRIQRYIEPNTNFCLTYGDGVSDVNINDLIEFHNTHQKEATMTAVLPPGRFGSIVLNNEIVEEFKEKPKGDGAYINGGFFVLSDKVFERRKGDQTIWEQEPLSSLAKEGELLAFKHDGFWHPMDTLRDKRYLNDLYNSNKAPWKVW